MKFTVLAFPVLFIFLYASCVKAQTKTLGLILNDSSKSYNGYTLFSPIGSTGTYLIDNKGELVHSWPGKYRPAQSVTLLPDGSLLRPAVIQNGNMFNGGGAGGRVERYGWDGKLIWSFDYYNENHCTHHDVHYLPNGDILMIAWENKTPDEAIAAGRNPADIDTALWPGEIIEVKPAGDSGGSIVWEWHVWDHLIQDFDSSKSNYGSVADHPELININYGPAFEDWLHINSIQYNAQRDEILLSVHNFNEIWIIDHSTTTAQAAGHSGGAKGKGGDIIYRWGNPAAYDEGTASDQKLFSQHDAAWIDPGLPGAGDIMIFNNGTGRPGGSYSSVDEITPPLDTSGNYYRNVSGSYGPQLLTWSYTAQPPDSFFAKNISGAERLPNGNTLICDGTAGSFFEIDSSKETVWEYVNPVSRNKILTQGDTPVNNLVFRISRYSPQYSGFAGKDLSPKGPIENYPSGVKNVNETPSDFKLYQNYPNPFNPSTSIKFSIPPPGTGSKHAAPVRLTVYDILGRQIAVLVNGTKPPGTYLVNFNTAEFRLSSGTYIYKLTAGNYSAYRKMMLLK